MTGGNYYTEEPAELKQVAEKATVYRPAPANARTLQPVWFWLVLLAGVLLLADVAVRRIAIEPAEVGGFLHRHWEAVRGRREAVSATPAFLERLKSRKAEVSEELGGDRAKRRFEGEGAPAGPMPLGADATAAPPPRPTGPTPRVEPEPTGDDFYARMQRAKRKAMEDKDKDKPK